MSRNRQWTLASRPEDAPGPEHFEMVEGPVPDPRSGEVLVRTLYHSVDPAHRPRMHDSRDIESYAEPWEVGQVMRARAVGEVEASEHDGFEEGDIVFGTLGWADYTVVRGEELERVDPDVEPISAVLGVLGATGRTAYFGMLDVGNPDAGDTVLVSGAAGAVGSVAGQIAKLNGCRVVGTAGSDEKVEWITGECGMDVGINYETDDVPARIEETCPDGIDVYFDNVGGPIPDAAMDNLALDATIALCGQISYYNASEPPTGPRKLWNLIDARANVEGFLLPDYEPRFEAATERLATWVRSGDIVYRETITEGLENAPDAFLGLFEGENIGKQLVEVGEPSGS